MFPGIPPLINNKDFLVSIPKTYRENAVALSFPSWPAIFLPGNTQAGSSFIPIDPRALWALELPWVINYLEKFHRWTVPAYPFPFDIPWTSTNCPTWKWLGPSIHPTGRKFSGVTLNSAKSLFGGTQAFIQWPTYGFFNLLKLSNWPTPTWIISEPSFSFRLIWVTWHRSI